MWFGINEGAWSREGGGKGGPGGPRGQLYSLCGIECASGTTPNDPLTGWTTGIPAKKEIN